MLIRNHDQSDSLENQEKNTMPILNWGWYIEQSDLPNEIIEHLSQLVGQYKERLFAISIMSNSISIGWNENGTHEDLEHFNRWSTELTQLFEDEMAIEE